MAKLELPIKSDSESGSVTGWSLFKKWLKFDPENTPLRDYHEVNRLYSSFSSDLEFDDIKMLDAHFKYAEFVRYGSCWLKEADDGSVVFLQDDSDEFKIIYV